MDRKVYFKPREAAERLALSPVYLRELANAGEIDVILTPGGQRRYDVEGYLEKQQAVGTGAGAGPGAVQANVQNGDASAVTAELQDIQALSQEVVTRLSEVLGRLETDTEDTAESESESESEADTPDSGGS